MLLNVTLCYSIHLRGSDIHPSFDFQPGYLKKTLKLPLTRVRAPLDLLAD